MANTVDYLSTVPAPMMHHSPPVLPYYNRLGVSSMLENPLLA